MPPSSPTPARSHRLAASRDTLRGSFSPAHEPLLTVDAGDTVSLTLAADVSWGVECHTDLVSPRRKIEPRDTERGGPALLGPIAVTGLERGMTLEVRLLRITPGPWGWTYVDTRFGNAAITQRLALDEPALRLWSIDPVAGLATDRAGVRVPIRPFPGTIGLCPAAASAAPHIGWIPTRTGGNMDCALLTAGATLYLPVEVPLGLLYIGDGHAAQGDGECGGTAIECPMDAVELDLAAHPWSVQGPVVVAEDGLATLGFASDVERAGADALDHIVNLLHRAGLGTRAECLGLASVAVDLRITQLVNMGVVGAHAVLRRDVMNANGWTSAALLAAASL